MIPTTVHAFDNPPRKSRQSFFPCELLKRPSREPNTRYLTVGVKTSQSSAPTLRGWPRGCRKFLPGESVCLFLRARQPDSSQDASVLPCQPAVESCFSVLACDSHSPKPLK